MSLLNKAPPEVQHALRQLAGRPDWETIRQWMKAQSVEMAEASTLQLDPQREPLGDMSR